MNIKNYQGTILIILLFSMVSCKEYLDAKPDQSLATISSVADLQGFLDDYEFMNEYCTPASAIAADNYYLSDSLYDALKTDRERDAYLWKSGEFANSFDDWQKEYNIVYMANLVLDGLKGINRISSNAKAWDFCKGSALLYRAKAFFEIAQVWAVAYDSATAKNDLGIPLRLTPDFNISSVRSSNEDTYATIVTDLKQAVRLLPDRSDNVFRPSKTAAYGLLSRNFLAMRKYDRAKLYADSCLALNDQLLDFNTLDASSSSPFGPVLYTNPEDIMHGMAWLSSGLILAYFYGKVDSSLYKAYDKNDLRKTVYFRLNSDGSHGFKAEYDEANRLYNGLATDEIYLNRAECLARQGDVINAMRDVNKLLVNRWKAGTFTPYTADNSDDALKIILLERRKELFYRMLRFTDLKRLNKDGANISLKRIIHGQTYILNSNVSKWALPIPDRVIELSGIQQN